MVACIRIRIKRHLYHWARAHCDQLKILINLTDLVFVLLLYLLHVHVLLYFCLGNTICKFGMLINLLLLLLLHCSTNETETLHLQLAI